MSEEFPGWRRVSAGSFGSDAYVHLSTGVELWRASADQFWVVRIPARRGWTEMTFAAGSPERVINGAEYSHVLNVQRQREEAHALALIERGDRDMLAAEAGAHLTGEIAQQEWADRVYRRMRYDLLCALQAYGLGAYGKQRLEEYARERGVTLPGMPLKERN